MELWINLMVFESCTSECHFGLICLCLDTMINPLALDIFYSMKAALLLKRQQNSVPDDDLDLGTDHSMADLIGETLEK